jgi:type I restriction enzyme R subunit
MGHHVPPEAITAAIDELTRDRSSMLLEQANREAYRLLKEGIPVSVADTDSTPHPGADSFAPAHSALGGPSPSANSSRRFPSDSNLPDRGGEGGAVCFNAP